MSEPELLNLDYEPNEDGLKRLTTAIVVQAMEDYGNALLGNMLYKNGGGSYKDPPLVIFECEQFFESGWIRMLLPYKIDKDVIKKSVRERVKNWPKGKRFLLYERRPEDSKEV